MTSFNLIICLKALSLVTWRELGLQYMNLGRGTIQFLAVEKNVHLHTPLMLPAALNECFQLWLSGLFLPPVLPWRFYSVPALETTRQPSLLLPSPSPPQLCIFNSLDTTMSKRGRDVESSGWRKAHSQPRWEQVWGLGLAQKVMTKEERKQKQ